MNQVNLSILITFAIFLIGIILLFTAKEIGIVFLALSPLIVMIGILFQKDEGEKSQ